MAMLPPSPPDDSDASVYMISMRTTDLDFGPLHYDTS